jgi:hypothetical protein
LADLVKLDAFVGVDGEHAGEEGTGIGGEEWREGEDAACERQPSIMISLYLRERRREGRSESVTHR